MIKIRTKMQNIKERKQKTLIPFIIAGLPEEDIGLNCIKAIEQGGCDILELGVPFSDPVADGEVIERFHHRGISKGLNLAKSLDFASKIKNTTHLKLILFSYYNPIYKMGLDVFKKECRDAGIDSLIIPDMPLDEMPVLKQYGLEAIPLVAPSSTDDRIQMAAEQDPAFIYCVSVRGVTGVRSVFPEQEIKDYLKRVASITNAPLAMGFGISNPDQIRKFHEYADAFVIGSYLQQLIERNESRTNELPGIIEKTINGFMQATV
ncbi:MAG: tryptophan synthase subunit alpha [Syntrophomonadaceae bacterium]|nr:tryptophan synthase subunit alpha [Syntrophomonadaceae bacterium]